MMWSFLWRAALYAPVFAFAATAIYGFAMGLFGNTYADIRTSAMVVQVLAGLWGLSGAYEGARRAQP
jgi:hypothetical protein